MEHMIETHPFGNFVPSNAKYFILGSFAGRQAVKGTPAHDPSYDWFYGTKRNQFWPILEAVYEIELKDKASRQQLFAELGIAMADIIHQCERKEGTNLDVNLTPIIYNTEAIARILKTNDIHIILFTSRFVEKKYKQVFKTLITEHPAIELVTLPSPSPRYVLMSREEKIRRYRKLLPKGK